MSASESDRRIHGALNGVMESIVAQAIQRSQKALRGIRAPWVTEWHRWARKWLSNEDRSAVAVRVVAMWVGAAKARATAEAEVRATAKAEWPAMLWAAWVEVPVARSNERRPEE